ncbi:MAG: hypothetical protein ACFFA3_21220 [Promethearchaeota archaeon]
MGDFMQNPFQEENCSSSSYLEFNKLDNHFYLNLFLKKEKLVVKIPLPSIKEKKSPLDLKVETFNLANCTYLTTCD